MTTTDNSAPRNLAALRLPELRKMAADLGLRGVSALRKGDLIAAITNASQQEPTSAVSAQKTKTLKSETEPAEETRRGRRRVVRTTQTDSGEATTPAETTETDVETIRPRRRRVVRTEVTADVEQPAALVEEKPATIEATATEEKPESEEKTEGEAEVRYESRSAARRARRNRARKEYQEVRRRRAEARNEPGGLVETAEVAETAEDSEAAAESKDNGAERRERFDRTERDDDRRNRRNRRNRRGRDRDGENYDNEYREENLQDIAGIVDIVDNNVAFVRTSGYHSGPADVYVNSQMIRRLGLRAGDAITGAVRMHDNPERQGQHRGRHRQKFNPLVRVDSINGMTVDEARGRPEFSKLTPLYPNQRLRLETEQKILTTRVIDLIMPIGKGQRALIVSPPKAGKTTILQNIANAIATNNPECYLMVVLVDERPEEVTDMQRSVKGEVIASTFDRPPSEHTAVAELAIERAKRLVEQGQDVVVLLDSITRLGRAYNNSSPASGRILSGGVDSNALYPPKRFLGAARNIENGGSLTIIATAMVETGSAGDTVIFEEFKGTGNAELKLDRKIAERRVFPAVDVNPSGTRKDELLLAPEEGRIMHKLRRILSALDNQQAIDLLIQQLKKTKNNREFLVQIASSSVMSADNEED